MRWSIHVVVSATLSACLLACGGGGGEPAAGTPQPVLRGPFVVDFEGCPDDGFKPLALPVILAPGIAVTWKTGPGDLYDFSTADGWNLDCDARAASGRMMFGMDCDRGHERYFDITFEELVSRVRVYAASLDGERIRMEVFDGDGVTITAVARYSSCPILDAGDVLELDLGHNVIKTVRIHGCYPVIDDLTYWRFE